MSTLRDESPEKLCAGDERATSPQHRTGARHYSPTQWPVRSIVFPEKFSVVTSFPPFSDFT